MQDGLGKRVVLGLSQQLQGLRYHLYFFLLCVALDNPPPEWFVCLWYGKAYIQFSAALNMKGKS